MPTLPLRITHIVRELEDGLFLHELLRSPELRILQTQKEVESLEDLPGDLFLQLKRQWLHERLAPPRFVVEQWTVEVSLPQSANTPWTSPLTLSFPVVGWKTGSGVHQAIVPDLELDILEPTLEALQRRLPTAILETLARKRLTHDFIALQQTQRTQELLMQDVPLELTLLSPLELHRQAQGQGKLGAPQVLKEVAQDASLLSQIPSQCFEQDEIQDRLRELLTRTPGRSVLLVGPSGVGKSVLYRSVLTQLLAKASARPPQPYFTSGARLVAGMSGFGQWQERCLQLVQEAPASTHLLHLGHLIELMDSGKSAHSQENIAGFLLNYIARGEIRVVVEATPEALSVIERQLPRALESLEILRVEEPSSEATRRILRRFLSSLPEPVPDAAPSVLERIERLHTRYATTSCRPGRPLRFLTHLVEDSRFELAPGYSDVAPLTEAQVLSAFSRDTGLPRWVIDPAIPFDTDAHRAWLSARVVGQEEAIDAVLEVLTTLKAGLQRHGRPLASFLCIGPTGVGKTQLARSLAELIFQSPDRMFRFDMSEYAHPLAVDRLVGGIQGKEGLLTAKVREQPFCVILLDELEKADSAVFDLLLQILGEGRLTDGAGRVADFSNTLILMTSNLGVASYRPTQTGFSGTARIERKDHDFGTPEQALRTRTAGHFVREVEKFIRPELFNRLDRILAFQPLSPSTLHSIVGRELELIRNRSGLKRRPILLEIAPEVQDWLGTHGYDARYGARPLKRLIERALLHPLTLAVMDVMPDDPPEQALVKVGRDGLEVTVTAVDRAQLQKATAAKLPQAQSETLEESLRKVQDLRYLMTRLSRSGTAIELRNETTRIHRDHESLSARTQKLKARATALALKQPQTSTAPLETPESRHLSRIEAQAHALHQRLETLRKHERAMEHLTQQLRTQEADLLLAMMEETPPVTFVSEHVAMKERYDTLLNDLYDYRFPGGNRITLLLLSEEPEIRVEWSQRYVRVLSQLGMNVQVRRVAILAGPPPKGSKRPPIQNLHQFTLLTEADSTFVVGAQTISTEPELLNSPGTLGALLEITGHRAQQMLSGEVGRHTIRAAAPQSALQSLVIQIVPQPPASFRLPLEAARQGALNIYPEKRRFQTLSDKVLVGQETARAEGSDMDSALKEIISELAKSRLMQVLEAA